jgi:hypothetical protein
MYATEELVKLSLKAIEEQECVTIEELSLYLPCSLGTIYSHDLHELKEIKEAINKQKVAVKKKMRRNWRNSENSTLQIAEFKLICSDDELDRLNTQRVNTNLTVNKPGIAINFGAE